MRSRRPARGRPVRQLLGLSTGVLLTVAVIGVGVGLIANARLTSQRTMLLNQITPAQLADVALEHGLTDEETGVRGYLLTGGVPSYRDLYDAGATAEQAAYGESAALHPGNARTYRALVAAIHSQADRWRTSFVEPALHARGRLAILLADSPIGRTRFANVSAALDRLRTTLGAERSAATNRLFAIGRLLNVILLAAGGLILLGVVGAAVVLGRTVTRPLERLGHAARRVAGGDFTTPLVIDAGAREIVEVGADVDAMRERIVTELNLVDAGRTRLDEQALELRRSNAELEQFAYVASHDLQEPLRKIASFCQALDRRYHGQLDERADQYIEFAVDGAKRMQVLINDLLAFSRVGRAGRPDEVLETRDLVAQARDYLETALADAGASVVVEDLPRVRGDRALLASLFQNLIANAVKFRAQAPPVIRIDAAAAGSDWEFSVSDNGIGIDAEYAERIFVIFQRLHAKETYPGTGIGLAMCRKIVEYHGGRIWLDTDHPGGACFRFTLPTIKEAD